MIPAEELRRRAAQFGAAEKQIVRDHLVSHVLHALSQLEGWKPTFFGGTALCRTWCNDARLSEDVDLLVEDPVRAADELPALIAKGIRHEFPSVTWIDMGRRRDVDTKLLQDGLGTSVTVQFVKWRVGWRILPVESSDVSLRYSDLPSRVSLEVPTPAAFVAMKCLAWQDRQAPRDLFDLAQLALAGHFTAKSLEFVRALGGYTPSRATFGPEIPSSVSKVWEAELRHQVPDLPAPAECWQAVLRALDSARATS